MNTLIYQKYLEEYIKESIANSDGSNADIATQLWAKKISGIFVRHKEEKNRALDDARKAFDEHRHWPLEIVLSHVGVDPKKIIKK
ncbi:MAG: hypothetical protein JW908_05240 [Anaerolineales bacterium]|nr:hypothetical protein [Anaerolineales bacterium]